MKAKIIEISIVDTETAQNAITEELANISGTVNYVYILPLDERRILVVYTAA